MLRYLATGLALALATSLPAAAQSSPSLENYFIGKQVLVNMDMPGTQQGIDLKFDKPVPMDWNAYSSRIKSYGVALHKGDTARVTKFVVKKDMIEFQLDGGGFGTAGDDTTTTFSAPTLPKTQYEKDLEKQLANTTDKDRDRRRDRQRDLDHERSRRERADAQNQADARIASQIKAQQVFDKRLHGGSRINLRWHDSIPSDLRSPEAVTKLLADYVTVNPGQATAITQPAYTQPTYAPAPAPSASGSIADLKRGMKIDEVAYLFGPGKALSQTTSPEGLRTQVFEYRVAASVATVTYVEGVIVRYSIASQ